MSILRKVEMVKLISTVQRKTIYLMELTYNFHIACTHSWWMQGECIDGNKKDTNTH